MTTAAKWLPLNSALLDDVRGRLASAVAAWSSTWFGQTGVSLSRLDRRGRGQDAIDGGTSWHYGRSGLSISGSKRAKDRLLELALDTNLNQVLLTDKDRVLLGAYADELVGDLTGRLEAALVIASDLQSPRVAALDPNTHAGGLTATLADAHGAPLIGISIALEAVMPLYLSRLPQRGPASEPLQRLSSAVATEPVALEVNLGQAELSMSELKGLAVGDVLVLDSLINDPATICLPHGGALAARAKLTEIAGELALVVEPYRM